LTTILELIIVGKSECRLRISIEGRRIGAGEPTYVIAEMSANHNQDLDQAKRIIQAAKEAGADAVASDLPPPTR